MGESYTPPDRETKVMGIHTETFPYSDSVEHVPDYVGHWNGEAWFTHHGYGVQAHMTEVDAERWIMRRVRMFGEDDLRPVPAPQS